MVQQEEGPRVLALRGNHRRQCVVDVPILRAKALVSLGLDKAIQGMRDIQERRRMKHQPLGVKSGRRKIGVSTCSIVHPQLARIATLQVEVRVEAEEVRVEAVEVQIAVSTNGRCGFCVLVRI